MMTMCVVVALCNIIKLSDDLESEKDIVTTFVFLCVPDLSVYSGDWLMLGHTLSVLLGCQQKKIHKHKANVF